MTCLVVGDPRSMDATRAANPHPINSSVVLSHTSKTVPERYLGAPDQPTVGKWFSARSDSGLPGTA